MANRHFGKLGDLWKHLPLMDVLRIERPRFYMETHAGSAMYPLTHSRQRDAMGVFAFLKLASRSSMLTDSAFFRLLVELRDDKGELRCYPGSPGIALHALKDIAEAWCFCDIDQRSLADIQRAATEHQIADDRLHLIIDDGLQAVHQRLNYFDSERRRQTLVLIDPYNPGEARPNAPNSLELFVSLARWGVKTLLWYGYHGRQTLALQREGDGTREAIWQQLRHAMGEDALPALWCGEIELAAIERHGFTSEADPGVLGCGLVTANLSKHAIVCMRGLGSALAAAYADAKLPDGSSGTLRFVES